MTTTPAASAGTGHLLTAPHSGSGLDVQAVVEHGSFRLDVHVTVAPGQVLGVLGPNGAGKTTLLRALAGLTALHEGRIVLDGQILDDAAADTFTPAHRRPVGVVFQNYRLFPHLSVRDNVAFAARAQGRRRRYARREAEHWLTHLDLTKFADRKPRQLSGGQAQRVALARALAAEPALLLLDEPLAALDARTKLDVRTALRRHLRDFPGPALLVTHDPLEAMVLTDRLLVIENGRIVQAGSPAEVARRPTTAYVARLMGLNLYPGATRADGAGIDLDDGGTLIAATGPDPGVSVPAPSRVLVALRPTAIAVHTTRPEHSSPRNTWPGTVAGLELLTDRVRIDVHGAPPALVDVTPTAAADLDLTAGGPVWLSAKATDLDVYPNPE